MGVVARRLFVFLAVLIWWSAAHAQLPQNPVEEMLQAAIRGDEAKVLEIKARLDIAPKPAKGDRKLARDFNTKALEQLASGNVDGAADLLTKASAADVSDSEIASNLGFALLKANKLEQAKPPLFQSIDLQPGRAAAWGTLAEVFALGGDVKRATAGFEIAYTFSQNRDKIKETLRKFVSEGRDISLAQAASDALAAEGIKPQVDAATPKAEPLPTPPAPVAQTQQSPASTAAGVTTTTLTSKATNAAPSTAPNNAPSEAPKTEGPGILSGIAMFLGILLFVAAPLILIVGLINPALVLRWGEVKTRGRVVALSATLFFVSVVLSAIFGVSAITAQPGGAGVPRSTVAGANGVQAQAGPEKNTAERQHKSEAGDQSKEMAEKNRMAERERLLMEMYSRINQNAASQLIKDNKLSEDQLLEMYVAAKKASEKASKTMRGFQGETKDHAAKVAALNSEKHGYYSAISRRLSLELKEKSDKTLFLRQYKADVILRNEKNDGWFADNFEIKSVDVYIVLSEPLFGFPVYADKINFSSIEPGETKVVEISSDFSGLRISEYHELLKKADKKGMTWDSNIFSF